MSVSPLAKSSRARAAVKADAPRKRAARALWSALNDVQASRYDIAYPDRVNDRHWAGAQSISPKASVDPGIRERIRDRARYEIANNAVLLGVIETHATYVIGTGPRLRITTENESDAEAIEAAWNAWAREVRLAERLRAARRQKAGDGEAFALLATNEALRNPVKLDLVPIEAERVASDNFNPTDREMDGIRFDRFGNPREYRVLDDYRTEGGMIAAGKWIKSESVIHDFAALRPGQGRGVSEAAPCLAIAAQLRRFTRATLTAAEMAALFGGVLETPLPTGADGVEIDDPFDEVELEQGMFTTLPEGMKLNQLRAEHPTSTYDMFERALIKQMSRPWGMPFNIAAGDSVGLNYASGRLDHQAYFRRLEIERQNVECCWLDRIFAAWLAEATRVTGVLPQSVRSTRFALAHSWMWPGFKHVDPAKEASAQAQRLASGTTNFAAEFAAEGRDWREEVKQMAEERAYFEQLGLPYPGDKVNELAPDEPEDAPA